jgi:type IV pilus assembly protein PilP
MNHHRFPRALGMVLVSALCLSACSGPQEELDGWMANERNQTRPAVTPLSPPGKFNPERYQGADAIEPFSNQKLAASLRGDVHTPDPRLAAELNRRKEPLEAFPLDSVSMVGSVMRHGTRFALLKVDSLLYQVKVGDYLGQNNGKIMKITETEISIRETVQDATGGELIERPAALQLQEGAQ